MGLGLGLVIGVGDEVVTVIDQPVEQTGHLVRVRVRVGARVGGRASVRVRVRARVRVRVGKRRVGLNKVLLNAHAQG